MIKLSVQQFTDPSVSFYNNMQNINVLNNISTIDLSDINSYDNNIIDITDYTNDNIKLTDNNIIDITNDTNHINYNNNIIDITDDTECNRINCDNSSKTNESDEEYININDNLPEDTSDQVPEQRPKRGIPKTILANQQKYLLVLEKQQKMIDMNKKNKQGNSKKKTVVSKTPVESKVTRRIIGGKIKNIQCIEPLEINKKIFIKEEEVECKLTHNVPVSSAMGHRIPHKYAKHMENEVKKNTIKNVKSFSDLRRITEMQHIDVEINTSRMTVVEMRKLNSEKRQRDMADQKLKQTNQRETLVQNILKNDKLSKFSKLVAIKNISANSRRQINLTKQKTDDLNL